MAGAKSFASVRASVSSRCALRSASLSGARARRLGFAGAGERGARLARPRRLGRRAASAAAAASARRASRQARPAVARIERRELALDARLLGRRRGRRARAPRAASRSSGGAAGVEIGRPAAWSARQCRLGVGELGLGGFQPRASLSRARRPRRPRRAASSASSTPSRAERGLGVRASARASRRDIAFKLGDMAVEFGAALAWRGAPPPRARRGRG